MKRIVISIGGSLIAPNGIDIDYIKNLKKIIDNSNKKFVLVIGGGMIAREYMKKARIINSNVSDLDLHWIGIMATRINAELVRSVFFKDAYEKVIVDLTKDVKTDKKIIVGAGYEPGYSSDMDAVILAKKHACDTVINLTNVDYIYNSDPRKNKDAKKIEKLSFCEFEKMFGNTFNPGDNAPFDPVAAIKAKENNIKIIVMNGKNLKNLEEYLSIGKFKGSYIY